MDQVVALEIGQLRESLMANVALVRRLATVRLHVLPETGLGGKRFFAKFTGELVPVLRRPVQFHFLSRIEFLEGEYSELM